MAKRILVPLDQTPEAEEIVPLVADTARGAGATVRLLHVAPFADNVLDADGRIVAYADQETARLEAEGLDYLRTIEARLEGIPVELAVRFGEPVREILAEAETFNADLIAVTAHAASRIVRLVLGSIVDQVCRRAPVAVMVMRPERRTAC